MIYYISHFYSDIPSNTAWNIAMINRTYEHKHYGFYGRINRDYIDDPTNHWFKAFGTSAKKGMIYYFEITNDSHKLLQFKLVG